LRDKRQGRAVATSEKNYLLELWDRNIYPNCGADIPERTRVGSGNKAEGGLCSLDCYTKCHDPELAERAKRVAALAARHRDS